MAIPSTGLLQPCSLCGFKMRNRVISTGQEPA